VHLELLGTVEAIARTKAEVLQGVRVGVVPVDEPLLEPWLPSDVELVRFGPGGDVDAEVLDRLELPFTSAHMRRNALAAVAAARAVGVEPSGRIDLELSAMRGQRLERPDGLTVIDDCYNANPLSMRAALDDLAAQDVAPPARRVAVLGDMLELGPEERALHREVGAHAAARGVDVLVTVGPLAREMGPAFAGALEAQTAVHADGGRRVVATPDSAAAAEAVRDLARPGDVVLVKASRGVRLEAVTAALVGA
jgi:UDP-N-acetylmuramoyl-tripeptide--D-alanyl-D-alanine ligase